jgi:hypothetical protein
MPHIFPTTHRDKHGKVVSFPAGAELLSRALDGVPQHEALTCSFFAGNIQQDPGRRVFHVMHVTYRKQARSFHHAQSAGESGVFDPKWSITVFAVPSTLRHEIKMALVDQMLPDVVRPWLMEKADVTGRTGDCALVLEYDADGKAMRQSKREALQPERA